jgi:hypothetical protein
MDIRASVKKKRIGDRSIVSRGGGDMVVWKKNIFSAHYGSYIYE